MYSHIDVHFIAYFLSPKNDIYYLLIIAINITCLSG